MIDQDKAQSLIVLAKKDLKKYLDHIDLLSRDKTVSKRQLLRSLQAALGYGFVEGHYPLNSNNEQLLAPTIRNAVECSMILFANQFDENNKQTEANAEVNNIVAETTATQGENNG